MSETETKPDAAPAAPPKSDPAPEKPFNGRLYDADNPIYKTEADGLAKNEGVHTPGLSFSPGLRDIEGSQVPALADGTMVNHVMGPGQAPVDPIAAGLDTGFRPATRAENRMVTQTGTLASGAPPSTYAGKSGVPEPAASDHSTVPAKPDSEAILSPGPNG